MALLTPERFGEAFRLLDKVLVFDEADQWRFSDVLSFGDVAVTGEVHGLVTQKRHTNAARLVKTRSSGTTRTPSPILSSCWRTTGTTGSTSSAGMTGGLRSGTRP